MRDAHISFRRTLMLLAVLPVASLAGCENAGSQLYVAYDTKLGLDASLNTAMNAGSVGLGYDRRFVTWVPRSVEEEPGQPATTAGETSTAKDVMAVLACTKLKVGFLTLDWYDESLATGRAARLFAEALNENQAKVIDDYFACFKKDPETAATDGSGQ